MQNWFSQIYVVEERNLLSNQWCRFLALRSPKRFCRVGARCIVPLRQSQPKFTTRTIGYASRSQFKDITQQFAPFRGVSGRWAERGIQHRQHLITGLTATHSSLPHPQIEIEAPLRLARKGDDA